MTPREPTPLIAGGLLVKWRASLRVKEPPAEREDILVRTVVGDDAREVVPDLLRPHPPFSHFLPIRDEKRCRRHQASYRGLERLIAREYSLC